jgi:hypothetical protein
MTFAADGMFSERSLKDQFEQMLWVNGQANTWEVEEDCIATLPVLDLGIL